MPPAGKAVHLDTSFLIRALVAGSTEAERLRQWLRDRRPVALSTLVWGEFLCGPLDEVTITVAGRIVRRHVLLGTREATEAARLFNHGGRRRGSFSDCLIAATAMVAGAELATANAADFQRFRDAGLELAG
jgi:predicted nucleic acid-binding protein